jgi:hypothetical protein
MNGQSQSRQAGASDWLFGALKQNPEGLLLLAAGCALLLRTSSSAGMPWSGNRSSGPGMESDRFARTAEGSTQYAADIGRQTKETASSYAGAAKDAASSYAASAAEYAGQARQAVAEQSRRVMDQAGSAAQSAVNRVIQEQPLVIALAGLAAGAAIAAAFPATEIEKQTLGPVGEQVADAARRVGEQVKEATGAAGDKLKDVAEERGLTPEGMKEFAKEVAGAFGNSMSGSAQQTSGNLASPKGSSGSSGPSGSGSGQNVS